MSAGIYMITGCAYPPSAHGDNAYGGKAEDLTARFEKHRADLKAGRHHNCHLQNYYSKYGEAALKFIIVKECDPSDLNEAEKQWIEENHTYANPKAFNLTPGGDGGITHALEYAFENIHTGEKTFGENIMAFCRIHSELNKDCIYRVHRGEQSEHKGWRKISVEEVNTTQP